EHARGWLRGLRTDEDEPPRRQGAAVTYPPLLEVEGTFGALPSAVVGRDDDMGLDPVVAGGNDAYTRLPPRAEGFRHGGEWVARVQHAGAHQMRRDVLVAERKPTRLGLVRRQFGAYGPRLIGPSPTAFRVRATAQRVHHAVQVGADAQPVQRDVIAHVHHGGHGGAAALRPRP